MKVEIFFGLVSQKKKKKKIIEKNSVEFTESIQSLQEASSINLNSTVNELSPNSLTRQSILL